MNDTIKDSIKQIEVLCFLFFWFLIFNRNAIEEELEVLYDAYYDELENYANIQQLHVSTGGASSSPPGPGPFPGSVEANKNGVVGSPVPANPKQRGRGVKTQA